MPPSAPTSAALGDTFAEIACDHDHARCLDDALARAEAVCQDRGARLTPVRRRVLELVWADHRPVGAYDLLARLSGEGWGSAPPMVYRALNFLEAQGLVHRLASINAFVGCSLGGEAHAAQFLICRKCGMAVELHDRRLAHDLRKAAAGAGFLLESPVVEITGCCQACAAEDDDTADTPPPDSKP